MSSTSYPSRSITHSAIAQLAILWLVFRGCPVHVAFGRLFGCMGVRTRRKERVAAAEAVSAMLDLYEEDGGRASGLKVV